MIPVYLYKKVQDERLPRLAGTIALIGHTGSRWSNETIDLQLFSRNEYLNTRRALMDIRRVTNRELFGPTKPPRS